MEQGEFAMDLNDLLAVGSAIMAIASAAASWAIASRQTELQYEAVRAEMDVEVVSWAQEAISELAEASKLVRQKALLSADEFALRISDAACKLSALADRGRLFFPNEFQDLHGQSKEFAFQGVRPPILDALVFACCQLEQLRGADDAGAAEFLVKCRRLLVSEAQNAVDPRRRKAMLKRLAVGRKDDPVSSFDVANQLALSLEERHPGLPAVTAFLRTFEMFRGKV